MKTQKQIQNYIETRRKMLMKGDLEFTKANVNTVISHISEMVSGLPQWVSIYDYLPDSGETGLLLCYEHENGERWVDVGGIHTTSVIDWHRGLDERGLKRVTHWMTGVELPEPGDIK